jgi:hypothetical protein
MPRAAEAVLALGHGKSGLPNITLQRSGGLALLARRPLSVRVRRTGGRSGARGCYR